MNPLTQRSRFRMHRLLRQACVLSAMLSAAFSFAAQTNRLLKQDSPNPGHPYATWDTAAHDIQTAINAATEANGDEVVVAPGVYDTGLHTWGTRLMTNRVVLIKGITVRRRDNDPKTTIIQGAVDPLTTNGVGAVRGAMLSAVNARLVGFTLTGGATRRLTDPTGHSEDQRGGGVMVRNGRVVNCILYNNHGYNGGGAADGDVYDSLIVSNTAAFDGGGAHGAYLHNCTVAHNRTETNDGAGARTGEARNSIFYGNVSAGNGGGVRDVNLFNCLVYGNESATGGGGVHRTIRLYNSTVVGNLSGGSGGGVASGGSLGVEIINSIVVGNASMGWNPNRADSNFHSGSTGLFNIWHSCIGRDLDDYSDNPNASFINNIAGPPGFLAMGTGDGLNHVPGDYRLAPDSPGLNTGLNDPSWMEDAVDIEGNSRIDRVYGIVDMGAYERVYHGTTILVR